MYYHYYSSDRDPLTQYISFGEVQHIPSQQLKAKDQPQPTEIKDQPVSVSRVRLAFATILNIFVK
jgi:hypothetical protein